MDLSPFHAGLATAPIAIGLIPAAPLSARLAARLGTRVVVASGLLIVAGAMVAMSGLQADSSYRALAPSLVLMGLGMGAAMAPATASVMNSLPLAHAGVGSAMNDTVRMVGGSLGVAVLGSLLSSGYGADMDGQVDRLPPHAGHVASDSIGGATAVADRIGGDAGQALNHAAEAAFTGGMSDTLVVAAGVAVLGALVALVVLPGRSRERVETAEFAADAATA